MSEPAIPPRESRDQRTPMAFLPYQQRWAKDTTPVKFCEKSRRIGLSWGEAGDSALLAASSSGMDVWYIGYTKDMAEEFIRDCGDWLKYYGMAASEIEEGEEVFIDGDEKKSILTFTIRCASGHRITALSSSPRNLRGKQGRVVIDEAAFVEDLAELLKAALALLMWGGQVIVISTHNGAENPFNEMVQDVRAGRLPYSIHRITLDDALADGLYRRICNVTKKDWTPETEAAWRADLVKTYGDGADEELFCIPNRSTGAYLTTAMIEACMLPVPVLTWTPPAADFVDWPRAVAETYVKGWLAEAVFPLLDGLPDDCAHFVGGDFGRTGDLSVFWPATETRDLRLIPPFVLELRNCPHRTQQQILFAIVGRLPRFSGLSLDARGNGSALAEAARQEYGPAQVREVMISEAWYRETMPKLKAGIEDKTFLLPKNADILTDFRALRVVKGVARVPDKRTTDKTGNRHGDAAVAAAMLIDAREKLGAAEPWEYVGVPMRGGIKFNGW